jgi:hypothetical protein
MAGGQPYTDEDDEALRRIHAEWQGAYGWLTAASKVLGRSASTLSHRWSLIKARDPQSAPRETEPTEQTVETAVRNRITSLDDLLRESKTDLELWEVERHVINKWEVGAKHPTTGKILTEPLWQVKAWLKKIPGASHAKLTRELLADIQADTKRRAKPASKYTVKRDDNAYCLEVDIFDLHLGKLAWGVETGRDYDSLIAERVAKAAVLDLLEQASRYRIAQVVMPFGNDFFQFDNAKSETTAGTRVDSDSRFHKMFRAGRALASWMIETCAAVAPVHVPVVPGNHDEQTAFAMGVVLEAEFQHDKRVTFDNSPRPRKYYRFGKTLLGYTHGNEEPHGKLPSLMALEVPDLWAKSTCREFHIGHLHTGRKAEPLSVDDQTGVTVRWIRSLSGTDSWHKRKGFVGNQRGAEAFVWKHAGGMRAHFITQPGE